MRHPGFFAMLWSGMDLDAPARARRTAADTGKRRRGARAVCAETAAAAAAAQTSRDKAMKRARRQGVTLWTA